MYVIILLHNTIPSTAWALQCNESLIRQGKILSKTNKRYKLRTANTQQWCEGLYSPNVSGKSHISLTSFEVVDNLGTKKFRNRYLMVSWPSLPQQEVTIQLQSRTEAPIKGIYQLDVSTTQRYFSFKATIPSIIKLNTTDLMRLTWINDSSNTENKHKCPSNEKIYIPSKIKYRDQSKNATPHNVLQYRISFISYQKLNADTQYSYVLKYFPSQTSSEIIEQNEIEGFHSPKTTRSFLLAPSKQLQNGCYQISIGAKTGAELPLKEYLYINNTY